MLDQSGFQSGSGLGDIKMAQDIHMTGTAARRPLARWRHLGKRYFATDTQIEYQCVFQQGTGPAWVTVATSLGDGAACSVFGRSANSTGARADIDLADGEILARVGSTVDGYNPGDFTSSDIDFAEYVLGGTSSATKAYLFSRMGGFVGLGPFGGRLTLTSGTWLTTGDVTAATTLYYTPGNASSGGHNRTLRSDGTRITMSTFTELSLASDVTQTGTLTNGSAVVTGLSDTSKLVRGMLAYNNINIGICTIASIDSATQVTLSANAIGSGTGSISFQLADGKNWDVFDVGGVLRWGRAWSSDTARTDALGTLNGVLVNNAAIASGDSNAIAAKTGVYLGTVRSLSAGLQDSVLKRYVWNAYNRSPRPMLATDGTDSWSYTTDTWRQANATAGNKVEYVVGLSLEAVRAEVLGEALLQSNSARGAKSGVGVDSTSTPTGLCGQGYNASGSAIAIPVPASYEGYPGVGYHYLAWLEKGADVSCTFIGDGGGNGTQTGIQGAVWA